ncbi:hypothetical protein L1O03_06780 [Corynebacterium uropygiale]|uniref:Secreted protein n=1 Tax=Corynebacterium uropygiale TaxID=1775911 RepID=A0A9X1QNX4_9CORY|nr:hypothetical protein [Corynebacterium uropygiale]MCF4006882.1 hypothetical protein [Corynebacterium uropygiale]
MQRPSQHPRRRLGSALAAVLTAGSLLSLPAVTATAEDAPNHAAAGAAAPAYVTLPDGRQVELPVDALGRPSPEVLQQITRAANTPGLPEDIRDMMLAAVSFFSGEMGGGPELPENGPRIHQFGWPSVAGHCIGGAMDSVGSALAVVGPSEIPSPGAGEGQTSFLFTALGTKPAEKDQQDSLRVHWVNLSTLHYGRTALGNHGINPDGPATVSGTADTGRGLILAGLEGSVRTGDGTCSFSPTAALIDAR